MTSSLPNIGFISLGCPKNLVDSERILTELRSDGYNIIPSYENADLSLSTLVVLLTAQYKNPSRQLAKRWKKMAK